MSSEHPMALELASLKAALEKYQHAAHTASLQMQRAHLETTDAIARSKTLEADNARLQHELDFLRVNPDTTPTSLQVSELTLALRRISDKLSLTEDLLLQRTIELTHSLSETSRARQNITAVHAELNKAHQREEACRLRESELERRCRAAEEEARMTDVVVIEYADLVRTLEGRRSRAFNGDAGAPKVPASPPSPPPINDDIDSYQAKSDTLVQSLAENRFSLQRLFHEFNSETSHLQAELMHLHAELSSVQADLECEKEGSRMDRVKLAEALSDVDRCKTDDRAAAKIVSRYMQFSQASINMLQTALSKVKSRHAATLVTLSSSSDALLQSLTMERKRTSQLRDVLDELSEDISRETFGRRREISLRLQGIVREERTIEALNNWLRRAKEGRARLPTPVPVSDSPGSPRIKMDTLSEELQTTLDHMIQDALLILESLSPEEGRGGDTDKDGSLGRVILAENMARSLTADLEKETEKRMALTRMMAREGFISPPEPSGQIDVAQVENTSDAPFSGTADSSPSGASPVTFPVSDTVGVLETISRSSETSRINDAPGAEHPAFDHVAKRSSQTGGNDEGETTPRYRFGIEKSTNALGVPPLLTELTRVSHRYDELQRAFRDCRLTLAKLKTDIAHVPAASQSGVPILYNVIHRLDDFCEDTHVELEIRIADEERIAQGFETLLGVPGALPDDTDNNRVELDLNTFLDGTTPSTVKAVQSCTSKLEDLQHDIAQLKRALHESITAASEVRPQSHPLPKTSLGWSSWTPPFISGSPSRLPSPAPSFGTVITAPRLHRVFSNSLPLSEVGGESNAATSDPYAHLGLRISMPSQAPRRSPLHPSNARLRKTSASSGMYLLGLGSHSGYFSKQEVIIEGSSPSKCSESEGASEAPKIESEVE